MLYMDPKSVKQNPEKVKLEPEKVKQATFFDPKVSTWTRFCFTSESENHLGRKAVSSKIPLFCSVRPSQLNAEFTF